MSPNREVGPGWGDGAEFPLPQEVGVRVFSCAIMFGYDIRYVNVSDVASTVIPILHFGLSAAV